MFVSRAICAILLILWLSFQNCPTFKQRLRCPPPPPPGSAWPFFTPLVSYTQESKGDLKCRLSMII